MIRCPEGVAGEFRVEFEYLETNNRPRRGNPTKDEFIADIGQHMPVYAEVEGQRRLIEDIPRASQYRPYEGELCRCELDWLSYLPGKSYSVHRRYRVIPLEQKGN